MPRYVHARLSPEEQAVLDELRRTTGQTDSEIVRRGLRLAAEQARRRQTALDLAGPAVGRFRHGPRDLSTSRKHLDGFGT